MATRDIRAIRALGHVTAGPVATGSVYTLLLTVAITVVPGAARAQTAQSPAFVAGGEINSLPLARPAEIAQLEFSAGAGETDNIFLTGSPTKAQTLGLLGLDFDMQRQGTRLDVDTKGDFQYLDYLQNAYGNHLYGRFDGTGSLALIPGAVKWVVQDDFGEVQLDPFAPLTPTNLENVNVLSTGPDLHLRLGATGYLEMGLRYALTHYQTSPLSGNREFANLAAGEEISSVSSISLNVDDQRLRFDDTLINTDYDRRELYARYQLRGARTDLNLDVGVSQTNESGHWVSAALAQLGARRLISPSTTLTFALGHQFTDAADSFRNLKSGAGGGIVIAPVAGTGDSYLSNYGSVNLGFERNRTAVTVSARWERDTYAQFAALDQSHSALSADLERHMTTVWSLELLGSWQRIRYYSNGYGETDWPVGIALVMTPGNHTDFKLRADHVRHDVTGSGVAFTESRVFLIAEYRPWL